MIVAASDLLRRKAHEYDLNAEAQKEQENPVAEASFRAIAVVLMEVANALEEAA